MSSGFDSENNLPVVLLIDYYNHSSVHPEQLNFLKIDTNSNQSILIQRCTDTRLHIHNTHTKYSILADCCMLSSLALFVFAS